MFGGKRLLPALACYRLQRIVYRCLDHTGMGNIMDSMKKAQEIAKQAEVINKQLMETIVIGNGEILYHLMKKHVTSDS